MSTNINIQGFIQILLLFQGFQFLLLPGNGNDLYLTGFVYLLVYLFGCTWLFPAGIEPRTILRPGVLSLQLQQKERAVFLLGSYRYQWYFSKVLENPLAEQITVHKRGKEPLCCWPGCAVAQVHLLWSGPVRYTTLLLLLLDTVVQEEGIQMSVFLLRCCVELVFLSIDVVEAFFLDMVSRTLPVAQYDSNINFRGNKTLLSCSSFCLRTIFFFQFMFFL